MDEAWQTIPEFSSYAVSDLGRIYNRKSDIYMQTSQNNHGHVKITLVADRDGCRYTRSVAQLVAEAFVEPPNFLCDHIIVLDGDLSNVCARNLAWRPSRFAWKYTHQMKEHIPVQYKNLRVFESVYGNNYKSIVHASLTEGLLFTDVWRSTYTAAPVYPTGMVFEIIA